MTRNIFILVIFIYIIINISFGRALDLSFGSLTKLSTDSLKYLLLEPWTYKEDFETRDLGAWASYPHWQDIAYNQNFRVNEIIPGDPNISLVQKITPYSSVDNYGGAQKLLDAFMVPETKIGFRYYLKSHQEAEWLKVRFAGEIYGKLDFVIENPKINEWTWVTVDYDDFVKENPSISGDRVIKINALAFLVKFPNADPDMPIYFGLDDIKFISKRTRKFDFREPEMYKLPESEQFISKKKFHADETLVIKGEWSDNVEKIIFEIRNFTDKAELLYSGELDEQKGLWSSEDIKLDFQDGIYLGKLKAINKNRFLSETEFIFHISPKNLRAKHPRLLFNQDQKDNFLSRLKEEKFKILIEDIIRQAKQYRENITTESLVFDLDQFPEEDWLPTWSSFGNHIYHTGEALRSNARAYYFSDDREAGEYVRQVLLKLSEWPNWTHPWQTKRGRFSEHRTGNWSHRLAEAYDLVFDLLDEEERIKIRKAILENIIKGVHRTYIHDDNISGSSSNWLAMTVGGSLMSMAAIYDDGEDVSELEPYFSGAVMKLSKFLETVTDSKDGSWGEGFGYNMYSLSNLSYSLPSIENVFNIDLAEPLRNIYNEYIWAGLIKNKKWFEYGDGGGNLNSNRNGAWAYLLNKFKDPRLSWFYNFINTPNNDQSGLGNSDITYEDFIFNIEEIPQKDPFEENPVKLFRNIGTTVFKSGWETDDFVFVMRTGAFYNHQHLDQGSFWLADKGEIFIEERPLANSDYYDDPIYESWFTQPVGHSTILINDNPQSQRVGDHLNFAKGFHDHAYVNHFLDGKTGAFAEGNIGRLYWDKVKDLSRNVLYLKPDAVLMLDVVVPNDENVKVSLLYQTAKFEDIKLLENQALISKNDRELQILNLSPTNTEIEARKTPHFLKTLKFVKPLEEEGMVIVSNWTRDLKPLVIGNLLFTSAKEENPSILTRKGEGYIYGEMSNKKFAYNTSLKNIYSVENITTDALAITWDEEDIFVAKSNTFQNDNIYIESNEPITLEMNSSKKIKYFLDKESELTIKELKLPKSVYVNGILRDFSYDKKHKSISFILPKGEGSVSIEF